MGDESSSDADSTSQGSGESTLPQSLEEGEIWVEYHPASDKKSGIKIFNDSNTHLRQVTLPSEPFDRCTPPWHPFRSRADFEQAELFIRYDCTNSYIDDELHIIHSGSISGHQITLTSAKEMHATLSQIPQIEELPGVRIFSLMAIYVRKPSFFSSFRLCNLKSRSRKNKLVNIMCGLKRHCRQ